MKNKKSTYIIVSISIFVGLLHFVIGPDYQGIFKHFIRGYLIDILLPMNLYLLLQISLRKYILVNKARIIGAIITFAFGTIAEILQLYEIEFLGRTYDPWDILMCVTGIGLGIVIDLTIIDKFEKQGQKNE
jgi:glycopeptide antibiotics resistance protein